MIVRNYSCSGAGGQPFRCDTICEIALSGLMSGGSLRKQMFKGIPVSNSGSGNGLVYVPTVPHTVS